MHVSLVELKSGRIPEGVTKRLGYWKAEEFRKFTYPASECILGGILPDADYHVWITLVRITELVYNTGRNGWSHDDVKLLKNLIARHNILTEETEGIKNCVVTLHNLLHLPDDIERFSSPDNYWCYVFERAVKGYIERSSNFKNLEFTFARAECRREYLKFCPLVNRKHIEEVLPLTDTRLVSISYTNFTSPTLLQGTCIYSYADVSAHTHLHTLSSTIIPS